MSNVVSGTRAAPSRGTLLIGPLIIFLAAVVFYLLAGRIDEPPGPEQLGAAFWPKMILLLLMVSCAIKAGEILTAGERRPEEAQEGPAPAVNTPKLALMIAMVIAAVYLMEILGFALANLLFLFLFMRTAGLRKKIPLVVISVGGTIFLLYLFVKVVYLPLPKGQWFFDDVTIFVYRILHII